MNILGDIRDANFACHQLLTGDNTILNVYGVCVCVCMSVCFVCLYVYTCAYICVYMCMCVFICMHVHACMCVCEYVHMMYPQRPETIMGR